MFTEKIVTSIAPVRKAQIIFPGTNAVTGIAIFFGKITSEEMYVFLLMAGRTTIGFAEIADLTFASRVLTALFEMTLLAFDFLMFALERKPGFLMIKIILHDSHRFKFPPFVIAMTFDTTVFEVAMKALLKLDVLADLFVAIQTFYIRYAFS